MDIRETSERDRAHILGLYPKAFPEEDLTDLVGALLDHKTCLSLSAVLDDSVLGHIAFTRCSAPSGAVLLGPLAIDPAHQRQGVGTRLIKEGLAQMKTKGAARVFVLGDPSYYGRLGFEQERQVQAPYPLPNEWASAWQSFQLGSEQSEAGTLEVPTPWQRPELW